jgi:hypothetical protein
MTALTARSPDRPTSAVCCSASAAYHPVYLTYMEAARDQWLARALQLDGGSGTTSSLG